METKKCSFCEVKLSHGTGKMYVKKDGSTLYFCSGRCEKSAVKLGRTPRKVKWISKKKGAK